MHFIKKNKNAAYLFGSSDAITLKYSVHRIKEKRWVNIKFLQKTKHKQKIEQNKQGIKEKLYNFWT